MELALKKLFYVMPFLFGIGFIAPLNAQTVADGEVAAPFGMRRTVYGLLIVAPWGLYAMLRGRWI